MDAALKSALESGTALKPAPEVAKSYVSDETKMKGELKGFDRSSLKKVEVAEKNPLPTKEDIEAEKTSAI